MNYDDLIFVRVRNTTGNPDFFKFESMNPDYEIPFDEWTIWRTADERLEAARLKLDAEDHFFPRPKIVNEHNVDAFLTIKKKASDGIQRGEWVKGKEISRTMLCDETLCIDYENFTCSVCGLVLDRLIFNVDGSLFYKFCPNCGASMTDKAVEILKEKW